MILYVQKLILNRNWMVQLCNNFQLNNNKVIATILCKDLELALEYYVCLSMR